MLSVMKTSWRNLWRNTRRTLINMSAVGLGLYLVVVYNGLVDGILGNAKNQLGTTGMGHVEIYAPEWRVKHGAAQAIPAPDAVLSRLRLPPGSRVGARLVSRGLATTAHGSQGVAIQGIDPATEVNVASYLSEIRQGELLRADDLHGVMIGAKLAERLNLRVGQKLRLMVQRADGEMGADLFRVRGIFHSISPHLSQGLVLITQPAARALLGVGDVVHQIVIQLARASEADAVAAALRAGLGPSFDVVTYGELLPLLKAMEGLTNSITMVMAVFVYLLVGLGILNTMLMSVLERTREFGVLRALGTRPAQIFAEILAEAFWIASISVAVGLSLGLLTTWVGSHHTLLDMSRALGEGFEVGGSVLSSAFRTEFSVGPALAVSAMLYILTLVVALYPAWRVTKVLPAEALRSM
jgi:ABC-type lipoprotein release transport system permease subunit